MKDLFKWQKLRKFALSEEILAYIERELFQLDIGASAAASRARISALERELAKINKDMIRCTERALSPPYEYVKVSGRHTYAKNPNLSYSPTLSKWSSVYF